MPAWDGKWLYLRSASCGLHTCSLHTLPMTPAHGTRCLISRPNLACQRFPYAITSCNSCRPVPSRVATCFGNSPQSLGSRRRSHRRGVSVRAADEDAEDELDNEFDQPVDILGTADREEQVYFGGDIEFDGEIDDALDDVAVNNDYNYDGDDDAPRARRGKRDEQSEDDGPLRDADGFEERVLQVSRVTKVVKGGKQMSFRAVVAVGDDGGQVGVGTASAKEVVIAVEKAAIDAKRHVIRIPITRGYSFPHRVNGVAGGAKVMLRPASEGTGVIAGGAVREVLELSGIKNGFGKQLGSDNPLNNARATVDGLSQLRTLQQAARDRDLTVEEMLGFKPEPEDAAKTPAMAAT